MITRILTFFLLLAFLITETSVAKEKKPFQPYDAYLGNLEEDDSAATVWENPKFNWKNCTKIKDPTSGAEYCKEAKGWPDRNSTIKVMGPDETHRIMDPFTGEMVNETFVKVYFRYRKEIIRPDGTTAVVEKEDIGYLPKDNLTTSKQKSLYGTKVTSDKEICDDPKKAPEKKPVPVAAIEQIIEIQQHKEIIDAASEISKVVGQCVIDPPTETPKNLPSSNIYDAKVLPVIRKQPVPKLRDESNQPMSQADLIDIDALARTLYGEMGKCFRKGLQYPMAAARVAVNRLDNEAKFQEYTGTNTKRTGQPVPRLTQILTTPEKFNNWMAKNGSKPNGPLHQSLCPPRAPGKPFWKEDEASKEAADVWKNAVRIATEAVLFPNRFKSRSPSMKGIHFYTSDMGKFKDSKRLYPKISDRSLSNSKCIELWTDPTPKRSTASAKKKK